MPSLKIILYIEDDASQREIMERLYPMCEKCFHGEAKFITANTWEAGLAIMRNGHVDVAVVDLVLPPMGRDDTLRAIHTEPDLPPVIVLTGVEGDDTLRMRSILLGADDFLTKTDVMRHPETLCERVYLSYLRHNRATLSMELP